MLYKPQYKPFCTSFCVGLSAQVGNKSAEMHPGAYFEGVLWRPGGFGGPGGGFGGPGGGFGGPGGGFRTGRSSGKATASTGAKKTTPRTTKTTTRTKFSSCVKSYANYFWGYPLIKGRHYIKLLFGALINQPVQYDVFLFCFLLISFGSTDLSSRLYT